VTEQIVATFTYEQERRFHAALGVTKVQPSGTELLAAAEGLKAALEQSREQVRALESNARSFAAKESESRALREQVGRLETQLRLAAKERDLDRRDAAEEDEYARDFAFRSGQRPVI
jgi:hypothetical protein